MSKTIIDTSAKGPRQSRALPWLPSLGAVALQRCRKLRDRTVDFGEPRLYHALK
jgi:hypothetical protein